MAKYFDPRTGQWKEPEPEELVVADVNRGRSEYRLESNPNPVYGQSAPGPDAPERESLPDWLTDYSRLASGPVGQGAGMNLLGPYLAGDPDDRIFDEPAGDPRRLASLLHGGMAGVAALGGISDLATLGANWAGLRDAPPTQYAGAIREQFPQWLQDFQPEGIAERGGSGLASGATSFAIPGAAGVGYMRGLPAGVRGLSGGLKSGLKEFGEAATKDLGLHSSRLGGANVGANLASQYAQGNIDPESHAQWAMPLFAGVTGSPTAARISTAPAQRAAVREARRAATDMPRSKSMTLESLDRLTRRIAGRLESGEVSDHDVLRAAEAMRSSLTGRGNPITDAQISAARASGDEAMARTLEGQKRVMDEIMAELAEAAELQARSGIAPTSQGVIEGAGIDPGRSQTAMHRALAADRADFTSDAKVRNELARTAAEEEARGLRPGATGSPASIREAARLSAGEAIDEASAPFKEGGEFLDLLDESGRIPLSAVDRKMRRMRQNLEPGEDRFDTRILARIDELSDLKQFDEGTHNVRGLATISPRTLRALTQDLDARINRLDPSPERSQLVQQRQKLDSLLLAYAPSDVRGRARQIKQDYSDMKEQYEPAPPKGRDRLDADNRTARRVAQTLIYRETGDPVKDILKSEDPIAVVRAAKKLLRDDPDRIAELEAGIWGEMFDSLLDEATTVGKVKKVQGRTTSGSALIEVYREVAGEAKASEVAGIVKRLRQSMSDPSVKGAAEFATGSAGLAGSIRGTLGNPSDLMRMDKSVTIRIVGVLAKLAVGNDSAGVSRVMTQAMLDPQVMLDVLSMPSREGFDAWRKQVARHAARTTVRESAKRPKGNEDG